MATTESTVINRQAPFMEDYIRKLLASGYDLADIPVDIPDIQIAGFTPEQIDAMKMTSEGIGKFQPFLDEATSTISTQFDKPGVAEAYSADQISQFMNPYTEEVIKATEKDLLRQGAQAQNQLAGNIVGSGAFGGSRAGITSALLAGDTLDRIGQQSGQLRAAGYESALQQARNLADAQIREKSLMGQLAGQQAGLGALTQQLNQQDVANLLGIGSLKQGMAQTVSATTAPTPSLLSQIGGVAATGLGLAGQLGYRPFSNTDNTGIFSGSNMFKPLASS